MATKTHKKATLSWTAESAHQEREGTLWLEAHAGHREIMASVSIRMAGTTDNLCVAGLALSLSDLEYLIDVAQKAET